MLQYFDMLRLSYDCVTYAIFVV